MKNNICELCGSSENLTKHHLIPQVKAKKKKYVQVKEETIDICDLCHRTIHAYFSENKLRDFLNTKEKLEENEKFANYLRWRKKHLTFESHSTKLSNCRK